MVVFGGIERRQTWECECDEAYDDDAVDVLHASIGCFPNACHGIWGRSKAVPARTKKRKAKETEESIYSRKKETIDKEESRVRSRLISSLSTSVMSSQFNNTRSQLLTLCVLRSAGVQGSVQ